MATHSLAKTLGNRIAPPRFVMFVVLLVLCGTAASMPLGLRHGTMIGFDIAAVIFLLSLKPLFTASTAQTMRAQAEQNDANRTVLLVITGAVMLVVLITVAAEISDRRDQLPWSRTMVVGTLAIAWLFSNMVFALHYAHLFYVQDRKRSRDSGGVAFPDEKEPDYWDFLYFSVTLGMTFQTSDVEICSGAVRRVATFHSLAAFVYNLGVLAFTINVLGASGGS